MSKPKTYLPQWSMKAYGPLYHGLWKVFDEDNFKLLIDQVTKKPAIFASSIAAINAAKAYVISLQPKIEVFKKEDAPVADILGLCAFYEKKADERAVNNIRRKNKKMKPFEVEVRRNGKRASA